MAVNRTQPKNVRSKEETARLRAIREKYQRERPTLDQLNASGDYNPSIPQGAYLELRAFMHSLRQERLRQGMTLTEAARRSGIEKAALSRLENGQQINPTWSTLWRYALSLNQEISVALHLAQDSDPNRNGTKRSKHRASRSSSKSASR